MAPAFRLASDIHTEFLPKDFSDWTDILEPAPEDVLVLAGDIGCIHDAASRGVLRRFLSWCSAHFHTVLYVPGNHEYYSSSRKGVPIASLRGAYQELCRTFPNVFWLDRGSHVVDGVAFVGCTLWSHVPDDKQAHVLRFLTDARMTWITESERWTPAASNAWFRTEVDFLQTQCTHYHAQNMPVVVITHHAPRTEGTSDPRFNGSPTNCAFSSDVHLHHPPAVWCFGHTHYNTKQKVATTQLVSNQFGYEGDHDGNSFRRNLRIQVESL